MRAWIFALQIVRPVALVALLLVTGQQAYARHIRTSIYLTTDIWGPWLVGLLLCATTVAVILVGRGTRHPWAVLALEGMLAAALAVVPPLLWLNWSGITWWTEALTGGPLQPLAIAWLGVVVATAVHQARRPRPLPRAAAPEQPTTSALPPTGF